MDNEVLILCARAIVETIRAVHNPVRASEGEYDDADALLDEARRIADFIQQQKQRGG